MKAIDILHELMFKALFIHKGGKPGELIQRLCDKDRAELSKLKSEDIEDGKVAQTHINGSAEHINFDKDLILREEKLKFDKKLK